MQQRLLSNRTLPITTTMNEPRITDRFSGTPHEIMTPTTKRVIRDAVRISARIIRTPGHVNRTCRNGTTTRDGDVVVSPPRDNGPVLIGGIVVPPITGSSGRQDITKKRQYTSPSISRNAQILTVLLKEIWPMTGTLWPYSAMYWVANCPTISAPTSICAVGWTSRVMLLE